MTHASDSHDTSNLGRVFDSYQNLRQIARCIRIAGEQRGVQRRQRVLELSRRATGLADYVDADIVRHATHVDNEPLAELLTHLPFDDNSFDACVVTDVYEHMQEELRSTMLAEMLRVTDGIVLIGCPHDDPVVTNFDRIAFDFIWGKYAEEFEPLSQHIEYGLEPVAQLEQRVRSLGATDAVALPCNYVYRWIHQILVYFDLQHRNPAADLLQDVNRVYNERLAPYDYREPCYRYLLAVPTDEALDMAALAAAMQGPAETPEVVAAAEGALIEAFRAVDSRAIDRARDATTEVARLESIITSLQADNQWALNEIELLRSGALASSTPQPLALLEPDDSLDLPTALAGQQWTSHNVRLTDDITTMPGTPDFFETDTRLAAIRRALRTQFGADLTGVRIADLGCLEGGFAAALALDGATVVGIEARAVNVEKADLLRRHFRLANLTIEKGDVKDFTVDNFGTFDVVLALGIAYHLDHPAAWIRQIGAATRRMLVVESHVAPPTDEQLAVMRADIGNALSPLDVEIVGDQVYSGRWYAEFPADISDASREQQLWASWSNHQSFWLTEESMLRAIRDGRFDVVAQHHDPTLGRFDFFRSEFSRGMFVGTKVV